MELWYHTCGCPINVWTNCLRRDGEPTFFDGRSSWTERAIRRCPMCGGCLSRAPLRDRRPAPAGTLAAYMLAWPHVRRQFETLIARRADHDPSFRSDQARTEILKLEGALNRVTELAAQLEDPILITTDGEAEQECAT